MTTTAWQPRSGTIPKAVGLVVHPGRPQAVRAAAEAAVLLGETGVEVVGCASDTWLKGAVELRSSATFGAGLDIVLVFGGDGTFLRAAYLSRDCGAALLGVNFGRLGFLTDVDYADMPAAIRRLAAGDFVVEERMTLSVEVRGADGALVRRSWALNEASVERNVPQRLVVLEARISDVSFAHIPADAVICATPTGSTAYAFSAGGPILSPLVEAILLVPVAAHSMFNRTVVVDPDETLTLRPVAGDHRCLVSCDGRETLQVPPGGWVRVSRGQAPVRMARLRRFDFYERVRDKFGLR